MYCSSGMVAIAALTAGFLASVNENRAPALTTAAMTLPLPYAESPRTRMFAASAPAALAVLTASVTMLGAPLADPARPAGSRTAATTGAALGVAIVAASGDRPRRRM